MTHRDKNEQMLLGKGIDRLAQCTADTKLQFVKNTVSEKCCKVKHNKMMCACTFRCSNIGYIDIYNHHYLLDALTSLSL